MSSKIVYRLEPVLSQKEEAKKDAAKNMAAAQKKLLDIQNEIELLSEKIELKKEQRKQTEQDFFNKLSKEGMVAKKIQSHEMEMKAIGIEIEEIRDLIRVKRIEESNARKDLTLAKEMLMEAAKEYKIMQKHKENFIREQRNFINKQEQKDMDEISSLIHNFREKGDE